MLTGALTGRALQWAYWGQQEWWRLSTRTLARAVRRATVGPEDGLSAEAIATLEERYRALLDADFDNVRRGIYPASLLFQIPYGRYAKVAPRLAADLPRVFARMKRRDFRDLPADVDPLQYPAYYRRTFHWQSDGYLSRRSAEIYDLGVEFLFGGTADVMRRQIIPPIAPEPHRRAPQTLRILDVGCGTARALSQLARAVRADYDAIDLSSFYLQEAAAQLQSDVRLTTGNAEALPWPDATFDVTFSVYLFHELPRAARRAVWREMFRVTRPGGKIVIMDSIQESDAPGMSVFLRRFNDEMHEPFFPEYQRDDLAVALRDIGLGVDEVRGHFLSKLVVCTKPARPRLV